VLRDKKVVGVFCAFFAPLQLVDTEFCYNKKSEKTKNTRRPPLELFNVNDFAKYRLFFF
jgi:hypothetical protein